MSETGSTYAHPYQITADGFKTRTYRTEAAMRAAAQKVANEIGREVSLWAYDQHNRLEYWGGILPLRPVVAPNGGSTQQNFFRPVSLVHVRVTGNRSSARINTVELPDIATSVGDIAAVLFPLTGGNGDTQVGVEITRAIARPEVVGFKFTWEG